MNNLTPQEKNKLLAAAEIVEHGDMAVLKKLLEFQDFVEENKEKIESLVVRAEESVSKLEMGQDGKDGEKGEQGDRGEKGEDGKNGKDGRDGRDGRDGIDGHDGLNGENGKDGSPDTPKEVRDKLETLKDDERLDISAIKGFGKKTSKLSDEIINRAIGIVDQRTSFLINKVSNLQTQVNNLPTTASGGGHTIQDEGSDLSQRTNLNFVGAGVTVTDDSGNDATIVTISTSAGAGYQVPSSGDIDGTNTEFVFAVEPNAIVVDGVSMRKVAGDTTVNWTGTTTITLTVAPNFDIYGVA